MAYYGEHTEKLFNYIEELHNELMKKYPTDTVDDRTIFYMNGNDSTDFDWHANNRLCEFGTFRKDDYYYIKTYIGDDGEAWSLIYKQFAPEKTDYNARGYIYAEDKRKLPDTIDLEAAASEMIKFENDYLFRMEWDVPIEKYLEGMKTKMNKTKTDTEQVVCKAEQQTRRRI